MACWASLRKLNASAGCQGVLITGRHGAATLEPTRQTGQFHGQHRGLQGVEAAVVAEVGVQIAAGHAVDGQLTDALGQLSVLAGHSTAITSRTQVFGGEEAEAPGITPAADGAASPAGACGLGAILNHQQLMAPGDGGERLHVHRTAKQMHRQQRLGGRGDGRLHLLKIDQIGAGIHIHKHRLGTNGADGLRRGKKTEGGGDDLITRTNAKAPEGQDQGIGAAIAAHGVLAAAETGKSLLKALDDRPTDVLTAAQNIEYGLFEVVPQI